MTAALDAVFTDEVRAEMRALLAPAARVKSEPLTYERHAPHSYFRDLLAVTSRGGDMFAAESRLARYAGQLDRMAEQRDDRMVRALGLAEVERRTTPNKTQGQGGYFTAPLWLIEKFATAPRTPRVLAALMPRFPLTQRVGQVNLPRITTGTTLAGQPENAAASETDVVDAQSQADVVTVAGYTDWPIQALEQSPPGAHLDWALFKDMGEAYDYRLELDLLSGLGSAASGPQILGVTNVTGINAVTYTSGSPAATTMYASLGSATAKIGNTRKLPPQAWLMTTSRWAWISSSLDSQNRPLTPPDASPPPPPDGSAGPYAIGSILGRWPVYLDDAIPTNLGAAANQDEIISVRYEDMILLESDAYQSTFPEVLSGTMQVRFSLRGYVAAFTGRYPNGISVVSGTGMVVQSGF